MHYSILDQIYVSNRIQLKNVPHFFLKKYIYILYKLLGEN